MKIWKKNFKKNIDNYDPRTYVDYLKLGDVNTKPFLMIAELIDNSISSFEKKYGNEWPERLIIQIKTNFLGTPKKINGYKVIDGSYISFVDNGFGMNKEELKNAVKLNAHNKSTSKMNVHGRGLKQCAFFFGIDLTIKTTCDEGNFYIEQKLSDQESEHSPYYIEVKNDNKESRRGTEILIENIREDKTISFNTWKRIKETLEFRYIKYLQNNKIKINCEFQDKKNIEYDEFKCPIEPIILVNEAFEYVGQSEEKFQKFLIDIKEEVKKDINKDRGDNVDSSTILQTYEIIKDLFIKSRENNRLEFKFSLKLEISGVKLPIEFWMLPKKHSKYRGIRFFEGERAILHAGYHEPETKPDMNWKHGRMETGSTENRFAGQCDLSLLGVKSKTDKSSFTIREDMKNELDKKIFSVWVTFNNFVMRSRKEAKNEAGIQPSHLEMRALSAIIKEKFDWKTLKLINESPTTFEYLSTIGKNVWNIDIIIDTQTRPKVMFGKNEKNNKMIVTVYTGHLFWKDMVKLKNDFYTEAVIPLTLLIVFQYIDWKEGDKHDPFNLANEGGKVFQKNAYV